VKVVLNKEVDAEFINSEAPDVVILAVGALPGKVGVSGGNVKGKIIPGLYAAGNVTGDFFANDYPVICPGLSHGRALTFGRIAGLNAAAEKV
jgi:fumarate reductase flavoprotein subunit